MIVWLALVLCAFLGAGAVLALCFLDDAGRTLSYAVDEAMEGRQL